MSIAERLVSLRGAPATLPDWAGPLLGDRGIGGCLKRLDDAIEAAATLGIPTTDAEAVRREVASRLGFPADAYVLALVGGTGVGKSSLLNALAGTSVSDASARRPTTAHPVAWIPRGSRSDLGGLLDWLSVPEGEALEHADGEFGELAILDLPDLDSVEPEHRERVEAVLPRVDAVVWVTDPEKYHDAVLHDDFLVEWLPRLDRQVVVLNKTDRLSADDSERVRHDLERDLARIAGSHERAPQVLLASARTPGAAGIDQLREWLGGAVEAKRVVRGRLVAAIAAAVAALAEAAGVDASWKAVPFVDDASRRETTDRVSGELLRVVDLTAAERQAVAATRARARARGAGPLGGITSRIYRWSGRQARVADPATFLARWRERGSLAPAFEVLRGAVAVPLRGAPPAVRPALAASVEPNALGTNLGRAVDRAIAARGSLPPSSRVWPILGALQTIVTLTLVFTVVWVGLWVLVRFPVDSIRFPVLGLVPVPVVVLVASLLAGYLIARLLGAHAGWLGRRWARSLGEEVRNSVAREVAASAFAGLDRLEYGRLALWRAAKGAGLDCTTTES